MSLLATLLQGAAVQQVTNLLHDLSKGAVTAATV
jgi:hypothetical protein